MRTGMVIAVTFMFVIISILGNISEQAPLLSGVVDTGTGETQGDAIYSLREAPVVENQNPISSLGDIFSSIGNFIGKFAKIMFLYYPALWQGQGIYVYIIFILPISLGMIAMVIGLIRGVSS